MERYFIIHCWFIANSPKRLKKGFHIFVKESTVGLAVVVVK